MPEIFVKPVVKEESASLLTTLDTYVTLHSFSIKGYKSKTFVFQATTNDLLFSIDFSADGGATWINRLTDIAVAAAAVVVRENESNAELRGLWTHARVQIKPAVSATHGTGENASSFGTL